MTHVEHVPAVNTLTITHKLDVATWGLFFLWVGVALMVDVSWGAGLLGVGIITLAGQVARKYFGVAVEPFWVAVALFFVFGGLWELLGVQFSLVPIMLIVAGLALLFSATRARRA